MLTTHPRLATLGSSLKDICKEERRGVWSIADICEQGGGGKDLADVHKLIPFLLFLYVLQMLSVGDA